jgi:energy-coupling factor transporter ATP-binding protein EcfA2
MGVSALRDTKAIRVIEVDSLSYKYPKGPTYSLKDVNFQVDSPRFVAIMGPTGAGKTTLAMTLNGLIPQLFEGDLEGYISVMGMDTQRFRVQTLVSKVGLVMQDPETQIFGITVKEDVAFGPGNIGLDAEKIRERIDDSLRIVRLTGYEDRFTSELSGGEKQRLAIAGILAMDPEILVLDEPTSELDPLGREEIYKAIDNLQRERNLTILAVEHSSEDVAERADEVIVVNSGAVVWSLISLESPTVRALDTTATASSTVVMPEGMPRSSSSVASCEIWGGVR